MMDGCIKMKNSSLWSSHSIYSGLVCWILGLFGYLFVSFIYSSLSIATSLYLYTVLTFINTIKYLIKVQIVTKSLRLRFKPKLLSS